MKKRKSYLITKDFVKKQIKGVNERINIVNSKVNALDSKVSELDSKVDKLDSKINLLEIQTEDKFDEAEKKAEQRYNKVMDQLVDIAGQFQKFDEERTVLAYRQRNHSDRIEKLEKTVFKSS
jgi:chromosome segregation ATPase